VRKKEPQPEQAMAAQPVPETSGEFPNLVMPTWDDVPDGGEATLADSLVVLISDVAEESTSLEEHDGDEDVTFEVPEEPERSRRGDTLTVELAVCRLHGFVASADTAENKIVHEGHKRMRLVFCPHPDPVFGGRNHVAKVIRRKLKGMSGGPIHARLVH